ncbi:transcriptional regulator MalT, partial [Vibrio parahaemolyticus]|nr:transcriptional regulator MalT [Vibrio parahaemolyticus]
REDALGMIESLNRYGLFIYPLEGEQNWFRFHNLFGEFLSHERQARIPQQEKDLHRNAAIAWLQQKAPHQAIHHAQKSNDKDLVVEILNEFGWKMFNQGELSTLESSINKLDDDLLFSHPKLTMLRAWLAQSQHRYNQVGHLLEEAEEEHKKRNIALDIHYQGQANALLAQVAINSNQPE